MIISGTNLTNTGYIIDALTYDLLYGCNSQTKSAAQAYRSGAILTILGQVPNTLEAFTFLKGIVVGMGTIPDTVWSKLSDYYGKANQGKADTAKAQGKEEEEGRR